MHNPFPATHSLLINWGDGTTPSAATIDEAGKIFTASHPYLDNPAGQPNGAFTITGTLTSD